MADSEGKFQIARDADGNAKGGVRLPHMALAFENGKQVGAPLGAYSGNEPKLTEGFGFLSGTFDPFSKEELAKRYPTKEVYVEKVSKSAAALLAERFVLQEDHDAYIKAAKYWNP